MPFQVFQGHMSKTAIIIGAGVAGLALSVRLAHKGYKVTVFDKNPFCGGKLHSFSKDGFRFDFGPSLFTMPQLVDDLFRLCNRNPKSYFNYARLPLICSYYYEDGVHLNAYADVDLFDDEVHKKLGLNKGLLKKYLTHSANIYKHTAPFFLENPISSLKTFNNPKLLPALANMPNYDLFSTMHEANERRLKEPHLVQLFNRYATYNGSDPYQAPGILNVIPALEYSFGAWYPTGGMVSITKAIETLALEMGVTFHLSDPVNEIVIENNKAIGVKSQSGVYNADLVISNADMWFTYNQLMPNQKKPAIQLKQERSSSALVFYWGMKGTFEKLSLHNILFSANYKSEFEHIFKKKTCFDDPTVYINITSKETYSDAPEGCENWFVMINVPNNSGQPWNELVAQSREQIILKINRMLGADIAPLILSETITDPIAIEEKTGSYAGSLYGTASNNKLAAFLRHKNTGNPEGLYFCGGSVHPGGGIPLCLWSARIVDNLINAVS